MIYNERTQRHEQVVASARQMLTAARTAPKARGVDIIEAILVEGDDLKLLADKMIEIGNERNRPSFIRDAGNVLQAECIVAIGTRYQSLGLNCGHCGFATCAERENFSLYSPPVLGGVPERGGGYDVKLIMGIAVSASSKNPFFDRPTK